MTLVLLQINKRVPNLVRSWNIATIQILFKFMKQHAYSYILYNFHKLFLNGDPTNRKQPSHNPLHFNDKYTSQISYIYNGKYVVSTLLSKTFD